MSVYLCADIYSNAFGRLSAATFDALDRATNTVDANGVAVTDTFDNLSRLSTRGYPDGGVERFGYSPRGLTAYTNQLGLTNFYGYDALARKTAETNANWEVTQFSYSSANDLLTLTDGKTQITTWHYDEYGRVTNKLDATSAEIFHYTYDPNGRLKSRWTPGKGITFYTNDAVGNLINISYPVSHPISFSFDAMNRLTNMIDAVGTTRYAYTLASQLQSEDGPWNDDTVSYGY